MNIAIIGAGLSGLHATATLHQLGHKVTLFEANDNIGGHVQTMRIPFKEGETTQEAIVDLGVFMFDPHLIHPYVGELIGKAPHLKSPIFTEIPLDFSLSILTKNNPPICFKTDYVNKEFSKTQILIKNLKKIISTHGVFNPTGYWQCLQSVRLMKEIFQFHSLLESLHQHPEYRYWTMTDFIKQYSFSDNLLKYWILPQMHCWWGSTLKHHTNYSIQVFSDSVFKVSLKPQYTFTYGVTQLIELLSGSIKDNIRCNSPIEHIIRKPNEVIINNQAFDCVLLAMPPCAALKILDAPSIEEKNILSSFTTTITTVYLHTDDKTWLPSDKKDWSIINLIQNEKGNVTTFWVGKLHPLSPHLFLTWGDELIVRPEPEKILKTNRFLRTLPTLDTVKASEAIHQLQGQNRTWYCGAHVHALGDETHSLWADNALKSGLQAAQAIHKYSQGI